MLLRLAHLLKSVADTSLECVHVQELGGVAGTLGTPIQVHWSLVEEKLESREWAALTFVHHHCKIGGLS